MRLEVPTHKPTREATPSAVAVPVATVTGRIAAHAKADPGRTAVIDLETRLSYGELESRSDGLSARLREAGAGTESCVALFFERSADFVVAALAVLKAGAAYLPMDPCTPPERAADILKDAGAPLLLSHRGKAKTLGEGPWRVVEFEGRDAAPPSVPNAAPSPSSLAYVIYTSGSTGAPKGVEITHANLQNLIDWHCTAFEVTAADHASQIAGLGFDAAAWEIWPHLAAGATLHIAGERTRRSSQSLRDWIVSEGITVSFVPTLLAEQLLSVSWPEGTKLRTLLTGADTLHRRPDPGLPFTFVNNYGPTECTVVATSGVVAPDKIRDGPPSIGLPIANTQILILDEALRPVATGEPGELCIAGKGVGRGYRNAPEMTAARFVTYQSGNGETLRVYRTGDRARVLENGEIAFLGRDDDQVKVRGYRIELGEIIACLDRYPGVEASSVTVKNGAADPSLVAYLAIARDAVLTAFDLKEYLGKRLPDYMIPETFVVVEGLPLTANGKLDKAALPDPRAGNLLPSGRAEGGEVEETFAGLDVKIAGVVAALLGQPVEPDDNFFLSGGHSMFGVQLVSRIRDTFGVKLTLRQLFNAPTVHALSAEVARLVEAAEKEAV